jgi:hypothetical protein
MTEAEILAEVSAHGDRLWSVLQYWTSVSFGLLIAAHFAAERINKYALLGFLLLYTAFSFTLIGMIRFDSGMIAAGVAATQTLIDNGESVSLLAQKFIATSPATNSSTFAKLSRLGMAVGLYVTAIAYPIYCYRIARR